MNYQLSTISRYVLKIFYRWFLIMTLGFAAIIMLAEAIEFFRRLLSRPDVSFSVMLELLLLKVPFHIDTLLPIITLVAAVMTFWRLNYSSELTVIRASGISIWKMAGGLSLQVVLLGFVYILIFNPIKSTLTTRMYFLEDKFFDTHRSQVSLQDTGLWLKERIDGHTQIFHARQVDLDKGTFDDVSIYFIDEKGTYQKRFLARKVSNKEGHWHLASVDIHQPGDILEKQDNLVIPTNMTIDKIRDSNAKPETLSWIQNIEMIQDLETSGLSSLPYRLHFYSLFAKVGLMVVMVFFAVCFCLRPARQGQAGVLIGLCLFTGLVYHFLTNFISAMGLAGQIPPAVAAAMPVLIGLFLSLALLLHAAEARK